MALPHDLQRLCESWWDRLADSTKAEQHKYAAEFLLLLGWEQPLALEPKAAAASGANVSYILRAEGRASIAAFFVMPGSLEPPSLVIERGLDFCETTRRLVEMAYALKISYVFVTDLFRSYLYDARTQELLSHSDSPAGFKTELEGVLRKENVETGVLEELRRQPRSAIARQFREWRDRWARTLVAASRQPEEVVAPVIDRLAVLRFLSDHDILKRPGWRMRSRFSNLLALAAGGHAHGCGKGLVALFHDLWFEWKADLFEAQPALDEVLARDDIAAPLLQEFALLSRVKFTIPTLLESFNYGDAAEKARVRMIPEEDEERLGYLNKQTLATVDQARIEVDLVDEGYRAILHWFDRLVELYRRLEAAFNASHKTAAPPDDANALFAWSAVDASRPDALTDKYQHAAERGLVVYYTDERQYRTARLLLYLHVISRYAQSRARFTRFPRLEMALNPRPRFLEKDRMRIYHTPGHEESAGYY